MPNWCSTTIKFYSENKKQVDEMYEKFREIMGGKATEENDFGDGWMGNFANVFFPKLGADKIDCRGWIDNIDAPEEDGDCRVFTIWTETAWGAKMGIWHEIVKNFYPDVCIAYIAEECGCDYFCVYDATEGCRYFPDEFCVDGCLPTKDGKCEYIEDKYQFGSVKEILEYLDKVLPFKFRHTDDIYELNEEIQKKLDELSDEREYDEYLYFQASKFEEISPAQFDFLT